MRHNFELVPLNAEIKHSNPERLDRMLAGFSCSKDSGVDGFLKRYAVQNERKGFSRTYLYIDAEPDKPRVAAFFSIAITSTHFGKDVTQSRRKKSMATPSPASLYKTTSAAR